MVTRPVPVTIRNQASVPDEHRPQPAEQEDAGLHHGGRVQVGRDRRGCRHGVRQPEVERELRRLGEGAAQHQKQDRQVERRGPHLGAAGQDLAQLIGAGGLAQQQHAGDQREAAGAGDHERHPRPLAAFGQVPPVADQQERGEAGELPEHQQDQHVVRERDAQHGALEQQQIGVEAPDRILAPEIPAGVGDDQQADEQDQEGEEQAVAVDEEGEIEPDLRHPGDLRPDHLAAEHGRGVGEQERQGGRGDAAGDQRAGVAAGADHQRRQDGAQERQQDDQGEAHPVPAVPSAVADAPVSPRLAPFQIPVPQSEVKRSDVPRR